MKATYGQLLAANVGFTALSKIGSKDKDTVKRLARMLVAVAPHIDEFYKRRDGYQNFYAKRQDPDDPDSEIITTTGVDGKTTVPLMKNQVEFDLKMGELLREEVELATLAPFTTTDLDRFAKWPEATVLANLGPFANLD